MKNIDGFAIIEGCLFLFLISGFFYFLIYLTEFLRFNSELKELQNSKLRSLFFVHKLATSNQGLSLVSDFDKISRESFAALSEVASIFNSKAHSIGLTYKVAITILECSSSNNCNQVIVHNPQKVSATNLFTYLRGYFSTHGLELMTGDRSIRSELNIEHAASRKIICFINQLSADSVYSRIYSYLRNADESYDCQPLRERYVL